MTAILAAFETKIGARVLAILGIGFVIGAFYDLAQSHAAGSVSAAAIGIMILAIAGRCTVVSYGDAFWRHRTSISMLVVLALGLTLMSGSTVWQIARKPIANGFKLLGVAGVAGILYGAFLCVVTLVTQVVIRARDDSDAKT